MSRLVCVAPNPAIDRIYEVDRLLLGTIHRPVRSTAVPGGKGLNVARAAHLLGADVVALAILRGHAGNWIEEALDAAGVPFRAIWAAGETRTCISVFDPEIAGLTEIYDRGAPLGPDSWTALEHVVEEEIGAGGEFVSLSGGIPPGIDREAFGRVCRAARAGGTRVLLDAHGDGLREAIRERPWLVKLNEAEAGELLGRPVAGESAAVTAASDLLAGGAETTIVTRGVAGAVIAIADVAWRVGPAPTQGRYAVGSGDVFLAGLAAGLLEGGEIVDAARLATGAAAANALIPGQGVFDARDARRMAEQVSVQRL